MILERIISSQLITYPTTNNITNILQSAYLPHKSNESALTLITSDLLGSILVLLDMSSAFDTLDHNVLIHLLFTFVITDISLSWFTSYIYNHSSTVRINSHSYPALSPMVFPRIMLLVISFLTFTSSPFPNIYQLPRHFLSYIRL